MSASSNVAGVLVSLRPEFATAVAEGRKTVELRRRFPQVDAGVWLVIYATQPVGALVGMARIEEVKSASVRTIWKQHRGDVAISKSRFQDYFDDRSRGFAVVLGSYRPLGPIRTEQLAQILPGFHPPQSWRYLDEETLATISEDTKVPQG